jgi:hypothetical protein
MEWTSFKMDVEKLSEKDKHVEKSPYLVWYLPVSIRIMKFFVSIKFEKALFVKLSLVKRREIINCGKALGMMVKVWICQCRLFKSFFQILCKMLVFQCLFVEFKKISGAPAILGVHCKKHPRFLIHSLRLAFAWNLCL